MTKPPLSLTTNGAIATITLNDQARRNAMGPAMINALADALAALLVPDSRVRVLVLTGAGSAFCSGGDMAESKEITDAGRAGEKAGGHYTLASHHHPVIRKLRELPFPLLTALNGPAVGMGMGYALLGDIIVARRSAYLCARFVKVGMTADAGSSWLLPRLIGGARAREMLLLGDKVSADQALSWGLINRVFDDEDFVAQTNALAQRLADGPPMALQRMRSLCWQAWQTSHEEQLHLEDTYQQQLARSDDALEGFTAFLEKRDPVFHGR